METNALLVVAQDFAAASEAAFFELCCNGA
jgi:hypothetical protein